MLVQRRKAHTVEPSLPVPFAGCYCPSHTKVKMDNPNITMEEYIRLEEEKAHRRAIVFNETLTSGVALSCEPTVSSLNDEINFRISFDESDDEDCTDLRKEIDELVEVSTSLEVLES
ncbi:hypothetical protein Tco_0641731 [Tanacetum coccineum]